MNEKGWTSLHTVKQRITIKVVVNDKKVVEMPLFYRGLVKTTKYYSRDTYLCPFLKGNNQMKKVLLALFALAGFTAAHAEVTGNLGLASDYRFRGISQTQLAPAVQGGIDFADKSGLYIGNWNSSVSSQMYTNGAGLESDFYAGYKKEFGGITFDVGSYNYLYPRASAANGARFDTNEVYIGASRGPVALKASQSVSDYFGAANSTGSRYYQADVAFPVAAKITLNAHAGMTSVANNSTLNYNDYNVGATYDLSGWAISAKYYTNSSLGSGVVSGNTINGLDLTKNALVVSASKSF